ncbi:MAG: CBS domain-containing protein [Pseudolabrys sp.]
MKAEDVMTRDVISIDPDATVLAAAQLMLQHRISGLPVIDKTGKLVGVLSEGDFLRRRETETQHRRSRWLEFIMGPGRMAAEYTHSHANKVSEAMTVDVQTVADNTPLEDIVELMERRRIKRVPVLCGTEVVGIVTRSNLMHAMVSLARSAQPAATDDASIRAALLKEMKSEKWVPVAMTNVVVHDGIVELWGVIVDDRQREALKVAAESIPGVKAVKDHLVWVEPMSGLSIESPEDAKLASLADLVVTGLVIPSRVYPTWEFLIAEVGLARLPM